MSIDGGFKKVLEGVKQAEAGRDEIISGLTIGLEDVVATRTADLNQRITDLQITVATLQALVLEHGEQLRALRARLNGDTHT